MIERYIKFFGLEETINLLNANEHPSILSIRVNTLKINPSDLKIRLEKKGFLLKKIDWIPYAFNVVKSPSNLGALHEYLQGYFYIQNKVSMLPPIILNPDSNDLIIDMCAAPGGKSTHLAQIMQNKGKLILIERNKNRIPALEFNLRRMGIYNSILINDDAKELKKLNLKGDKILLDAPCTGEGLIRDDPERKNNRTMDDIKKITKIQEDLLSAGLVSLKNNGLLLYSTCSIAPEENEYVINNVLKRKSGFKIEKIHQQFGIPGYNQILDDELINDLKYSQRFFPHIHDSIGFFICLIKKN